MNKQLREDQILFLQKIKPFLLRNHHTPTIATGRQEVLLSFKSEDKLGEIIKRLERLEKAAPAEEQDDGFRKSRIKDKVLTALQERKRLTASQMSDVLGLSRTRCSEYFRELMIEGKVEGVLVDRQKFYKLVKQ
ncbi:MAG: winged helix-turn-helix domain-containing protein [Candidatus Aenigmarchaeota archaeon]|nr:winged helix-turn-helix domain-containing protein [Candidatus Aenigmarchaeota archaeon]